MRHVVRRANCDLRAALMDLMLFSTPAGGSADVTSTPESVEFSAKLRAQERARVLTRKLAKKLKGSGVTAHNLGVGSEGNWRAGQEDSREQWGRYLEGLGGAEGTSYGRSVESVELLAEAAEVFSSGDVVLSRCVRWRERRVETEEWVGGMVEAWREMDSAARVVTGRVREGWKAAGVGEMQVPDDDIEEREEDDKDGVFVAVQSHLVDEGDDTDQLQGGNTGEVCPHGEEKEAGEEEDAQAPILQGAKSAGALLATLRCQVLMRCPSPPRARAHTQLEHACERTHIHRHARASIHAHTCFSMHSWARIPLLFLAGADGSWNSAPAKQRVGTGITGGGRVPACAPRDLLCRVSPKVAPLYSGLDHWFDLFCLVVLGLHRTHGLVCEHVLCVLAFVLARARRWASATAICTPSVLIAGSREHEVDAGKRKALHALSAWQRE